LKFKDDVVAARFNDMHPKTIEVAKFMDNWCQKNYKIELTITSTVSTGKEDRELQRISDTHRTGRAFDVRTKDLPDELVAELCSVTRKEYGTLGAVASGNYSLIVYKPHGTFQHLHVQLNRKFIRKP
jgi:hypothetical protein